MTAVIYARYSSDNQREESIEGQIRECTAYAEKNGITVVKHYIDRALSAKTDNRPDFQQMIKDSEKRLFDIVLVWKLDRFARNRYDSAHYEYQLERNHVKLRFSPRLGVDRARIAVGLLELVQTMKALDAGDDITGPAPARLAYRLRISNEAAGHGHDVGLSGSQHCLNLLGPQEGSQRQHGNADIRTVPDCFGQIRIAGGRQKAGRMGNGPQARFPHHTGRNMDDIDPILNELDELYALVNPESAGDAFRSGNTILNEQIAPYSAAYGVQHHERKTRPVLQRAAELVRPMVAPRRNKLLQQRAVAAMNQQGVKTAEPDALRQFRIACSQLFHLLHRHLVEAQPVAAHKIGTAVNDVLPGLFRVFSLGAEMYQLIGTAGIIKMHGAGHVDEVAPARRLSDVELGMNGIASGKRHFLPPAAYAGHAAPGLFQVGGNIGRLGVGRRVVLYHVRRGGGGEHPVLEGDVPHGQRGEHVRIMLIHALAPYGKR